MKQTRLCIYNKKGKDISDEVEIKNGKSNPFGWAQTEVHYKGNRIGWIESGVVDLYEGFTYKEIEEEI